jgi:hypothetical protein
MAQICVRRHRHETGIAAADGNRCSNRASSFPLAQPSHLHPSRPNPGSTVYLCHAQLPAPLLWRGTFAFHHHQLLPATTPAGQSAEARYVSSSARTRNPVTLGRVLAPEQREWSSFRHFAYSEPGPVMVNGPQKAELRIRKIS